MSLAPESKEEMKFVDRLVADAKAGQPAILEDQLKAGVPMSYVDNKGDLVQKHPDGRITLLKEKKDLK